MAQSTAELFQQITGRNFQAAPTAAMLADRGDNRTTILNSAGTQILGSVDRVAEGRNVIGANGKVIGTLNASGGVNLFPVLKQEAPKATALPASQGGGFDMKYYQGWDETAARADWKATNGSKGQQAQSQTQGTNLDSIFEPGMKSLQDYENTLRNVEMPLATDQINTTQKQLMEDLESQLASTEKEFGSQFNVLQQGKESSYAQAIRLRNNMKQQGMTRFGGGSSMSGAISELIDQEFLRNRNNVEVAVQRSLDTLLNQKFAVVDYVNKTKGKIKEDTGLQLRQLNLSFNQKIDQINSKRGELQSAKASALEGVLREQAASAQRLKEMKIANEVNLDNWARQQEATLTQGYAKIRENTAAVLSGELFQGDQALINKQYSSQPIAQAQSNNYNYALPRNAYNNTRDDTETLINPFA